MDRTGFDVSESSRRNRCQLLRSVSSVQPRPRECHRGVLLVGVDSHLWPDGHFLCARHSRMISPRRTGNGDGLRHCVVVHGGEFVWCSLGRALSDCHRHGIRRTCIHFSARGGHYGASELAARQHVSFNRSVRRLVRRIDQPHGRASRVVIFIENVSSDLVTSTVC